MDPDHMSDRIFGGRKPGRCCQEVFSLGRIHSRFPTGLMSRLSHVGGPSRVPLRSAAVPPRRGVVTHPLRLLPPKPWRRASRGRPSCIEAREGAAYLARRGSTPPSVDRRRRTPGEAERCRANRLGTVWRGTVVRRPTCARDGAVARAGHALRARRCRPVRLILV